MLLSSSSSKKKKIYLLLEHVGLGSLVYLQFDYRQGRQGRLDHQDGVPLQLGFVFSRKGHAWLGIP